ncbi:putative TonB-dependent receptor [Flavihumibacter petaseus NBRC 106054]|uniref:Putative TonB-dependent receptor n=2 Tax=Flavihumibacter TaxID=1004301 RepID=A0A0E9MY96_9BACT|nr:putative TonB-dependent receptor [Flavihumibacter petaseus NBRC 106054]
MLVFGQASKISGKVYDGKGSPIPFATIKIKGKTTATTADNNGSFIINAEPTDVLIVTSIGYDKQEITLEGKNSVILTMSQNKQLEEVVVTAQGIRRRPRELGYSVAKVSNEDLRVGRSPQLAQSLSGKVSGLAVYNVNNSVDPQVKITLRGYRSISGNNDALVVIDGLPMPPGSSTMLNILNPNDIESVSILKGGQAATLYGSAGVNGALVITTKKGGKGKLQVTYSNSTNVEEISFLPDFQDKYGSGSHYAASFGSAGWKPDYLDRMKDNWRSYENQQYGDAYDGSIRPAGRVLEDGSVLELPYSPIDNIRRKIWDRGYNMNNQVSFSGGSDLTTFFMSLENNIMKGVVPGDQSKRTGVRMAAKTEMGRLSAGFNAAYVQANYDRTTFDFYNEMINQAAHIPLDEMRDWKNNKFASPNAYYNDYFTNPYHRLDNDRQKYQDNNVTGNIELNYKVSSWLNLYNKLGVMSNNRTRKNTVGKFLYSSWAKNSAYVPEPWDQDDGEGITRTLSDLLGSTYDASTKETVINNEFQAQFNKDFGDFGIKGLVGYSTYERKTKFIEIGSNSVVVPDIYNVGNRQGALVGGENNTNYRKYGYYVDATAGWKDMVFLHGSFRYDYSSLFYKADRPTDLYAYPSAGMDASVILTELLPVLKSNILGYAKLRAGYNTNGNDNINNDTPYPLDLIYSNAPGFPYNSVVGITRGDVLPDPNLKPETINSFEVGGEFQFLNNRISLDATYYTANSKNSILTVKVPNSTAYNNLRLNVGETKNWGYELDLKLQAIRAVNFDWDLNFRYSFNDNEVIKLYPGVDEFSYGGYAYASSNVAVGQAFPFVKAVSYIRDPATNKIVVSKANGYPATNGPLKNLGRAIPKHILGAGTRVRYKDLTLTANFEYRGGNVMYSDLGRQMTFTGSGGWTEQREPFVVPNSVYDDGTGKYVENTDVKVAEAEYSYWVDRYRLIAENFTVPAWFIKLRDINVTYNFSPKLVAKTGFLSGASLGLFGRNLITIVDSENQFTDPEYSFTTGNGLGINNTLQTPPVRQYGFNLNITFK